MFIPTKKKGGGGVLAILKGGVHKQFWGSFNTGARFPPSKRGRGVGGKVLPCLWGGGRGKKFLTHDFPIAPVLVINNQSLRVASQEESVLHEA